MKDFKQIAANCNLFFKPKNKSMFPSVYADVGLDGKEYWSVLLNAETMHGGSFTKEVGRFIIGEHGPQLAFAEWNIIWETSNINFVDMNEFGLKPGVPANKFLIAISKAITSYGSTLNSILNCNKLKDELLIAQVVISNEILLCKKIDKLTVDFYSYWKDKLC